MIKTNINVRGYTNGISNKRNINKQDKNINKIQVN